MKKIIFFLLLVVIGIGIYFSFFSSQVKVDKALIVNDIEQLDADVQEELILDDLIEEKEENSSVEDIDKALASEKDDDISEEVEPEMVEDAKDIMVETDIDEVQKELPIKEGITPVASIKIPKNSIKNLNIGDTVSLPYMGNGQFDAKISDKQIHKNGSVTVTGNLVDSDKEYSVVLTEGKSMSFGTITTPNGSFEIETKNGVGYVYSTDDIDKKLIDYSKKDTLVPTDAHSHE